jgi:D-methionine transport system permease protein
MYDLAALSLFKATWETIYMVFISSFISIFLGLILGSILFVTKHKSSTGITWLHRILEISVNVTRSLPFIILMIAIIPFTRLLVGTTIGSNAAIVPLTIAAIPFFARICENALAEVPHGLIEAAHAMGASTWQTVIKVLLPESLPTLIRGATLTIIGLIGYSAMAGVVGGGGLGELAINYGYQRFDVVVMLETVILLIILVQLIQVIGDVLAKHRKIKPVLIGSALVWALCLGWHFYPSSIHQSNTLRVGVMSGWEQDVMKVAKKVARQDYGIDLQIVAFSDYVQPNVALNNGSIDANIFQHDPYLQAQIKAHHYAITPIAKTFVYPMGFYSKKIKSLSQLKEGDLVAIPNDPSNEGRALLLLEKAGLITLKPGVTTSATVNDIVANKYHLRFKILDAAQLPRVLHDADLVAITNDFVGPAGLSINQALIKESSDSPYANLIVTRDQDKDKPIMQKLIAIMHSESVVDETEKIFPHGAAVPAWNKH